MTGVNGGAERTGLGTGLKSVLSTLIEAGRSLLNLVQVGRSALSALDSARQVFAENRGSGPLSSALLSATVAFLREFEPTRNRFLSSLRDDPRLGTSTFVEVLPAVSDPKDLGAPSAWVETLVQDVRTKAGSEQPLAGKKVLFITESLYLPQALRDTEAIVSALGGTLEVASRTWVREGNASGTIEAFPQYEANPSTPQPIKMLRIERDLETQVDLKDYSAVMVDSWAALRLAHHNGKQQVGDNGEALMDDNGRPRRTPIETMSNRDELLDALGENPTAAFVATALDTDGMVVALPCHAPELLQAQLQALKGRKVHSQVTVVGGTVTGQGAEYEGAAPKPPETERIYGPNVGDDMVHVTVDKQEGRGTLLTNGHFVGPAVGAMAENLIREVVLSSGGSWADRDQ